MLDLLDNVARGRNEKRKKQFLTLGFVTQHTPKQNNLGQRTENRILQSHYSCFPLSNLTNAHLAGGKQ